ncbi:hypothetical protein BJM39_24500 [Salmonella enterica subsp. enterica serovar Javiana]|nr:hypothetical protein BJM39_24500 [Salmonella enterica subsp. enterica serovar Javiana]
MYSALAVLAWVATSAWLYRARVNSERLSKFVHERSAVWCWLGWVVPVVAWWFPRQVVRDVHRASSPEHAAPRGLDLWWGLFVGGTLVSQAADRLAFSGDELSYLSLLAPLNVAATVMLLGALLVWVRIVTATVRLQEAAAGGTPLSQGAGAPLP